MAPRILVVEDEVIIATQLEERLRRMGYDVAGHSNSGEDAVKKALDLKPDIILMDIVMPGKLDGINAAERIKQELDIPVIFLTAFADDSLIDRAKRAEPLGYILKPYQENEIKAVIELSLYKIKLERELVSASLSLGRDHLAAALKIIEDGVMTTDRLGKVILLNKAAEELTGWKKEEAFGKNLPEVFCFKDEKSGDPCINLAELIISESAFKSINNRGTLSTKDGRKRTLALSCLPISDKEKNIGAVIVFRDITEIEKKEEKIITERKLESMGTLAEGIAHNFNNILTALLLNLDMAKTLVNSQDGVYERLIGAEKAGYRIKDLARKLLLFSKGVSANKKKSSISQLIRKTLSNSLRGSIVKSEFYPPDDLWPVLINVEQITNVLANLIDNAVEAMPEGGVIKITAENVFLEQNFILSAREGKYIKITIQDNGVGIPKGNLHKIFDPFFTTKKDIGSGLGLSSAYSAIKWHDGYIDVTSEVGVGTTFYIYLPACE
ncbi:MAG TPA: ATP-binding protein [archaeon]|nr:ATP-binding protein [archaeon]